MCTPPSGRHAELPIAASVTKMACSEAFLQAALDNMRVHGGIGFTWEHDAHLYVRRAKATQLMFGSPDYHAQRLAAISPPDRPMKGLVTISFSLELPTQRVDASSEFVTADAIGEIAREAEACGFAAVHVTDHPAPDAKWLDNGGHHALDPFVALSFAAASTTDIKLLTNVYIAAYRNPFLGAKSIQSLDVLSRGRLILGTAAGYLKPEFRALGFDFDNRGALLDEALDVLEKVLTGEDIAYEGTTFAARGVRLRPVPATAPPVWIGGNSNRPYAGPCRDPRAGHPSTRSVTPQGLAPRRSRRSRTSQRAIDGPRSTRPKSAEPNRWTSASLRETS